MKWRWSYLFNIDTLVVIILVIAVVYCYFTSKRKRYKFLGLKDSDFVYEDAKNIFDGVIAKKSKSKKKKKVNQHEERCREIFQRIYKQKFKSVRPKFLKNPATGRNLELDGYCPNIRTHIGRGIAFEYDGIQHSKFNGHFHRQGGEDEFIYQTKKDQYKDMRCKEEGIVLVRIPHWVAYEDLERFITNKLKKLQILPSQLPGGYTSHHHTSFGGVPYPHSGEHRLMSGMYV